MRKSAQIFELNKMSQVYTIFEIDELKDISNQDKLLLIQTFRDTNELATTSILEADDKLTEYAIDLLKMESDEFNTHLISKHHHYAGMRGVGHRLLIELIPRMLHIYNLIAARAVKDRIKFFYDDSFMNYIEKIDERTLDHAETFGRNMLDGNVIEIYSVEKVRREYDYNKNRFLDKPKKN